MKKRMVSLLLVLAMLLSMCPSFVVHSHAAETNGTIFAVENAWSAVGSTVKVNILVENNTGITYAGLKISWADGLTLVDAENGSVFGDLTYQEPNRYVQSGTNFIWYGNMMNTIEDGVVLTLTFEVAEDAPDSTMLKINVAGDSFVDNDLEEFTPRFIGGGVRIVNYIPGDVNGDGAVNGKDLMQYARYASDGYTTDPDGYNIVLNENAADVNDDGKINGQDLIMISRYISDGSTTDPDGYNIILKPVTPKCTHANMIHHPYKAVTCTADGNVEYYVCDDCGLYFNNAEAGVELTWDQIVLVSTGHNTVIDEAVAPTYENTGLTEGSHCSVCGEVFVAQEIVPVLQANYHSITYHNLKTAEYPEVTQYAEHLGTELPEPAAPGYEFMGWYAESDYRTIVDRIPANSTQDYHLYAKWELVTYNIYFDPANAPEHDNPTTYTVEDRIILRDPTWAGLAFTGWTDADGKSWKEIPKGTTGDLELTANWKLMRNIATPGTNTLMEVEYYAHSNLYVFIYELGTIEHVVLEELNEGAPNTYYHSGAADFTLSVEQTLEMSEEVANSIARTISKSVSTSSEWETSKEWAEEKSIEHSTNESIGIEIGKEAWPVKTSIEASYGYANASGKSWGESSTSGGSYGEETENGEETSSSLAYTTTLSTTTSSSITVPKDSPLGYYSYAHVGNIRVFGIVTYDPKTQRVYLNTYSMLDNMHDMLLYYPTVDAMNHPTCETLEYKIPRDKISEALDKAYFVKYDANGGTGTMDSSMHTIGGKEKLLENEFTREGYIFTGWESRNEDGTIKSFFDNNQVIEDIATRGELVTLYAQWEPVKYTINYDVNQTNGASTTVQYRPEPTVCKYDEDVKLADTPMLPGYSFLGWYYTYVEGKETKTAKLGDAGEVLEKANLVNTQNGSFNVFAKWEANTYTLSFELNGGTMDTTSKSVVFDSQYGSLGVPQKADHVFVGWYLADGTTEIKANDKVRIYEDHKVYAKWLKSKATIYQRDDIHNPGVPDVEIDDDDAFWHELVDPGFNKEDLIKAGYSQLHIVVHFDLCEIDQGNQWMRLEAFYDKENTVIKEWKYNSTPSGWTYYEESYTIPLDSSYTSNTCAFYVGYDAWGNGNDDWWLGDTCYTVTALKN